MKAEQWRRRECVFGMPANDCDPPLKEKLAGVKRET